jgi:hypothetical protein
MKIFTRYRIHCAIVPKHEISYRHFSDHCSKRGPTPIAGAAFKENLPSPPASVESLLYSGFGFGATMRTRAGFAGAATGLGLQTNCSADTGVMTRT